ncbi:MAG: SulP family inorganic anion transporter [Runella sp.]
MTLLSFKYFSKDFNAGLSVFLVALPLCLGIALASGAPLLAGILAGIVGGIIVTLFSGSEVSVSGPAAGLTLIVFDKIEELGSFQNFLTAVVLAGVLQLFLGWLKAGRLSSFVPYSVLNGMLVAIGLVIVLKQIPHAFGWDADFEGDFEFLQTDHRNTFSEITEALRQINIGAMMISVTCLLMIGLWEQKILKKLTLFSAVPVGLAVVIVGVLMNQAFLYFSPHLYLGESDAHMVRVPVIRSLEDLTGAFNFPNVAVLTNYKTYVAAFTLAVVASIESLLNLEAADKLDPQKRVSSANQELKAQGIGNIFSGLMGGLPVTSVIVRTSANIYSGGQTRLSSFIHGVLLLVAVAIIPDLLNHIPLACLAALLISVGYKLAKYQIFKKMYKSGQDQFIPFMVTILAVILTDLLMGIGIGLVVGIGFVIYSNSHSVISTTRDDKTVLIVFKKDVSFLNKARLTEILDSLQKGDKVFIDGTRAQFIDYDIYTVLEYFQQSASHRGLEVKLKGIVRRKVNYHKSNESLTKTFAGQ